MTTPPRQSEDDILEQLVTAVADLQRQLTTQVAAPADDLEIKTDAGDFAVGDSWVGRRVVNTADNTYKIFLNGAWRQLFP